MRPHPLLAAVLLTLAVAPAHSASPGLNLQALHVQGLLGDVVFPLVNPLVGGLGTLPSLDALHGVSGVVPGLVSDVAIPLVGTLVGSGLPALPGLGGLEAVVPGIVSDVALPLVGGVAGALP